MDQLTGALFAGGFSLFFYLLMAVIFLVVFGGFIFWIWMIIDCAMRPFPPADNNLRLIWILVLIFVGWIGALVYLLVYKIPQDRKLRGSPGNHS